jgi:hypothetical protein
MTAAALLALALAAAPDAHAAAQAEAPPLRVERRLLVKAGRWVLDGGVGWLARGDYYTSPGVALAVAYYPWESGGPELRLVRFFSHLDAAAQEVRDATGLVPDSHEPKTLLTLGWRQSFGYGKVLPFGAARVLHFDFQGVASVGLLRTDRTSTPALGLGPAFLVRMGDHAVASLDVGVLATFEERANASVTFGVLTSLALGARL